MSKINKTTDPKEGSTVKRDFPRGKYRGKGNAANIGSIAKALKGSLDIKPSRNDPAWYVAPGQMSHDIADFPFGQLEGAEFTFDGGANPYSGHAPSVGVVYFHSVIDSECLATNGATQAARALYTWVRHQNSGHTNYEAPDLGMYILAANECSKIATYCKRLLKLFNTYKQDSRVLPTVLLNALGLSNATITSMQNEIPSFRGRVNLFIRKLSQFAFPSDVSLFSVQNNLLKDVYADTMSIRRQYYYFEPSSWLQFDATTWPTGSALSRKSFRLASYTSLLALMDDFDLILDAMVADEDINIMSGDILKAYRSNNRENELFAFEEANELDTLEILHDDNVLKRLHMAHIMGTTLSYGDIVQSSTGILHALLGGLKVASSSGLTIDTTTKVQLTPVSDTYKPTVADNDYTNWAAAGLDAAATLFKTAIYDDDVIPSSDDVIERTRWMVLAGSIKSQTELAGSGTWYYAWKLTHGTEIIQKIVWYDADSPMTMENNTVFYIPAFMECLTAYKYFPICYVGSGSGTAFYTLASANFTMWYDVYTFVPHAQLSLINKVVLFNELGVRSVMKVITK